MRKDNTNRWRCLVAGCNPRLYGKEAAEKHRKNEGHRVAKWPVRSAEGKRRARHRNKSGYYDKYNVGAKSRFVRMGLPMAEEFQKRGGFTLTPEDRAWD